ncbi:ankyrin repeat-containing domain protein [Pelagophyceae sp. CCMP2097]|nr:ankyrin repeat-containing domain protein [Pelagophyceae sp. CCMP2097]
MASFEEAPSSMHSTARAESADSADLAPLEVSLAQASLAAAAVAEVTAAAVAETAVALVAVAATVAAVAAAAESLDAADEADDAESDDDASESDDEQSDDESPEAAYVAAASRDETGLTALHWAGIDGNSEAATALLAAGCQVDATDEGGWTALHETAKAGHADVVALLLAAGADAAATSLDGHTALHVACANGALRVVAALTAGYDGAEAEKVRAYVDKRDGTAVGATALHHAAFCGHLSVVQLLVARGADVEKAAASRATVLHFASQQPDGRIAQFLERRGAQKLAPFQSWARAYVELLGDAAEYTEVEPDVTRMDDVCEDVCEDDARGDDGDGRPPRFTSHRVLAYDSRGTRILVDALCFAAPEALNAQLAAAAEALQREPSARASNHGGFHSQRTLFDGCGGALAALRGAITNAANAPEIASRRGKAAQIEHAWLNVNGSGHFNARHNHSPAPTSGVYYVAAPKQRADQDGRIAFRLCGGDSCDYASIQPESGLLLLFPGDVDHAVFPHHPTEEGERRISISFNLQDVDSVES